MLSDRGMRLEFRRTRENVDGGKRTSDTFLIVGSGEEEQHMPLEFKQPKGSGKNNIYNQLMRRLDKRSVSSSTVRGRRKAMNQFASRHMTD